MTIKVYVECETLTDQSMVWNVVLQTRDSPSFKFHAVEAGDAYDMAEDLLKLINKHCVDEGIRPFGELQL